MNDIEASVALLLGNYYSYCHIERGHTEEGDIQHIKDGVPGKIEVWLGTENKQRAFFEDNKKTLWCIFNLKGIDPKNGHAVYHYQYTIWKPFPKNYAHMIRFIHNTDKDT